MKAGCTPRAPGSAASRQVRPLIAGRSDGRHIPLASARGTARLTDVIRPSMRAGRGVDGSPGGHSAVPGFLRPVFTAFIHPYGADARTYGCRNPSAAARSAERQGTATAFGTRTGSDSEPDRKRIGSGSEADPEREGGGGRAPRRHQWDRGAAAHEPRQSLRSGELSADRGNAKASGRSREADEAGTVRRAGRASGPPRRGPYRRRTTLGGERPAVSPAREGFSDFPGRTVARGERGGGFPPARWSSSAGRPTHLSWKRPPGARHRRMSRRTTTHPEHGRRRRRHRYPTISSH
jgi:hypothetical protein